MYHEHYIHQEKFWIKKIEITIGALIIVHVLVELARY